MEHLYTHIPWSCALPINLHFITSWSQCVIRKKKNEKKKKKLNTFCIVIMFYPSSAQRLIGAIMTDKVFSLSAGCGDRTFCWQYIL